MAQDRYFKYNDLIRSKESSEAIALASGGIGPKIGFNSFAYSNGKLVIYNKSLWNQYPHSYQYLLTRDNKIKKIIHCVVTTDGIITTETDPITISCNLEPGKYYFVLASHRYIEDNSVESPTTYSVVEVPSMSADGTSEYGIGMSYWLIKLDNIDPSLRYTHVIVSIIKYTTDISVSTIYTPYNYVWPIKDQLDELPRVVQYWDEQETSQGYIRKVRVYKYPQSVDSIYKFNIRIEHDRNFSGGEGVSKTIKLPPYALPSWFKGWCMVTKFNNAVAGTSGNTVTEGISNDNFIVRIINSTTMEIFKQNASGTITSGLQSSDFSEAEMNFDIFIPDKEPYSN